MLAFETGDAITLQSFTLSDGVATATATISATIENASGPLSAPSLSGATMPTLTLLVLAQTDDGGTGLERVTDLDQATPTRTALNIPVTAETQIDSTVLDNGNTVVLVDKTGTTQTSDQVLDVVILAPDGSVVTTATSTAGPERTLSQATITALIGGGFVISYQGVDGPDADVFAHVFNADGSTLQDSFAINSDDPDAKSDPQSVALEDGGFLYFYDSDTGADGVFVQRFDGQGQTVGAVATIDVDATAEAPTAALLDSGLVAVTYVASGVLKTSILATQPLDLVLNAEDNIVFGTDGDDRLDGSDGDDILIGGAGADALIGGEGLDTASYETAREG